MRQSLRAVRQTHSAAATALTPAVALTLDMAHLAGYIHGILDRPAIRRARGSIRCVRKDRPSLTLLRGRGTAKWRHASRGAGASCHLLPRVDVDIYGSPGTAEPGAA